MPRSKPRNPAAPKKAPLPPSAAPVRWSILVPFLAVLLLVAAGLRIYGSTNDLWLDEIIAINTARQASSPLDIIATNRTPPGSPLRLDGQHQLYTLYLYAVGPQSESFILRIPSLLAGIGTVLMAWLIGRRRDLSCAMFAMLLVGFSYVLVLYSSEARGYALGVFFSFVAFYALDRYLENSRWPFAVLFSASVVLGLLAQLTFVCFYLAAIAWCAYRLIRSRAGAKRMLTVGLWCHAAPLLFIAWLYDAHIRDMGTVGGTPSPSLIHSYGTALAWALGPPSTDVLIFVACVVAVAALYAGIARLWREKADAFVLYLGVILVFPILLIAARGSDIVYVRYFLVSIAFLLLLCSVLLSALYRRGRLGRLACTLLLVAFVASNGGQMATFFQYGRGQYREALRYMKEHAERSPVVIGGDQDYRIGTQLQYYAPTVMGAGVWQYIRHGTWPPEGPEWLVCQRESFEPAVPELPRIEDGRHTYEFVRTFPTAPLAGLHWFLYHNQSVRGSDDR
jgi:hypothetical protein